MKRTSPWGAGFQPAAGALFGVAQSISSVLFANLAAAGQRPAPRMCCLHYSTLNHRHSTDFR